MNTLDRAKAYINKRVSAEEPYESLLEFPRYIELETVNTCNARCPMCTIDDWQRDSPTMKDALFEKIATELCEHADVIKRVALYRDGEPLLDKKLAQRTKRLKDGGIRNVGISTNVSLLDERRSVKLLEAGLDEIVLSIDSLKKDVYEAIRLRLNFETVIENALRFIELRNKIRPECSIWIRMVRQESNKDEVEAYQKFWTPHLKANDRCYHLDIHNWGSQLADYKAVAPSYQSKVPCVALWSLMVIFANGDVPMCNVDYNSKHPMGEVRTRSIKELWTSRVQAERREKHLCGNKGDIDMCRGCTVWSDPTDGENLSEAFAVGLELA